MKLSRATILISLTISLFLITFVPLLSAQTDPTTTAEATTLSPRLLQFIGRLHPLLLHFPIALICTVGFIEFGNLFRKQTARSNTSFICLIFAVIFAAAATASGLANAEYESHSLAHISTLNWHRWLGIITASTTVITLFFMVMNRLVERKLYRRIFSVTLLISLISVAWAAHLGGSMIYGAGYLTEVWQSPDTDEEEPTNPPITNDPASSTASPDTEETASTTEVDLPILTVSFATDIKPIFEARCFDCHSSIKQKGDLRLDTLTDHWQRDEEHWVIKPGSADTSDLIRRVQLAATEKGHMPPKGERLTAEQVTLITTWINEGATQQAVTPLANEDITEETAVNTNVATIGSTNNAASTDESLRALQAITASNPDIQATTLAKLRSSGAVAHAIAKDSAAVEVAFNLLPSASITDNTIDELAGLEDTLVWLNLSKSEITNAGLTKLQPFTQLRRLHLENTTISDDGIAALAPLEHLEYLNLFNTNITDAGLTHLAQLKNLRRLYLWQTAVTRAAAQQLSAQLPNLVIIGVTPVEPAPVDQTDDQ